MRVRPLVLTTLAAAAVAAGFAGCGSTETVTTTVTQTQTVSSQGAEKKQLEREVAELKSERSDLRSDVTDTKSELKDAERELNGTRAKAEKSRFDGDGTFLVGSDVLPGTYRADATPGCYWERSTKSGSIIDNDNADGPVVINLTSSDYQVKTAGCSEFKRSGQ